MAYTMKVIVVGDMSVGKSSLIAKYIHDIFNDTCTATIGVDFIAKNYKANNVVVQFWDIAGSDRFAGMTQIYYRDARAAIVVFSEDTKHSMEKCLGWKKDIDEKLGKIPCILVRNKIDLVHKPERIPLKFLIDNGFDMCIDTSAKYGTGLRELDKYMVNITADIVKEEIKELEGFLLNDYEPDNDGSSCCSS